MDEQVELETERKREILELEEKVASANLFEFLGVTPGASVDEVRAAFRELSRKFHPDRYFGKNLGSFRARLDKIFKRLVEANQTLSDETKRKAYLEANPFVRAAVKAASGPAVHDSSGPQTEEDLRRAAERRARLARHPYLLSANKQQEIVLRAKEAMAKHEYSQAFTHLSQANPENGEVKALLVEVRRLNDAQRALSSYNHGVEAQARGDEALALQAFKVAGNAGHADAAFKAAKLLDRLANDVREATSYAQKAVEGMPTNVEYRVLLVMLLERAGMKALAKKHLEEVARLDPNNAEVKKQGKKRWPF
jgi:curved DNA-binding protein CbpA